MHSRRLRGRSQAGLSPPQLPLIVGGLLRNPDADLACACHALAARIKVHELRGKSKTELMGQARAARAPRRLARACCTRRAPR
jgi:hypothetical protein